MTLHTEFTTDSRTIILEGSVEHPTDDDLERINAIADELSERHRNEDGKIVQQSSKGSGYKQLRISWVSKPKLVEE